MSSDDGTTRAASEVLSWRGSIADLFSPPQQLDGWNFQTRHLIAKARGYLYQRNGRLRRPVRSSLATRLSASYFGMSFLLIALTSSILYWCTVSALRWADDQVLEKRMLTLRAILQEPEPNEGYLGHEVSEDLEGPRRIYMRVVSDAEILRVETPDPPAELEAKNFPDVSTAPLDELHRATIVGENGRSFRVITARVPLAPRWHSPPPILQVAADISLDEEVLSWFRRVLAALLCAALIACWTAARYIVNRELGPLRQIAVAASKIDTETLSYRLAPTEFPLELHNLATQFNEMLARLEAAYGGLRHYADNIAHELRSPVNKMLLSCEVALLRARSTDEYRESLESNIEECNRLSRIMQSLLFLARADNAQATITRERIVVGRELKLIQTYFDAIAETGGVKLEVVCSKEIVTDVDRLHFQRAVGNLVSNSLAHTPAGGTVIMRADSQGGMVAIAVEDTGIGIGPEHLPRVFDRFYRADRARSSGNDHLGLGLSIVKSIVELHGGTILIKSEIGLGTRVTMTFPDRN